MAELKRHVGRVTNTGARAIVVFRKIPGDEGSCLIVESDRLPEMYHDNIMTILNSREAQGVVDLYNVLHRRTFADGGNCLQVLHEGGYLRKISVGYVEMLPYPNTPVSLTIINTEIDGSPPPNVEEITVQSFDSENPDISVEPAERQTTPIVNDPDAKADSLIARATLMEDTAAALKEEAYMLVPKMRPGRGRPKLTAEEAAAKKEERNAKRRERYAKEKESATSEVKAKPKAKAKAKPKAKAKAKPKAKTTSKKKSSKSTTE